jgi:hypothetical protein
MNNQPVSLAQRRAELVEMCAAQRSFLAEEFDALKSPFGGHGVGGWLGTNKTMALAIGGVALGLAVARPKKLLSLAAAAVSAWKVARTVLPMLARPSDQA